MTRRRLIPTTIVIACAVAVVYACVKPFAFDKGYRPVQAIVFEIDPSCLHGHFALSCAGCRHAGGRTASSLRS
jgi:hypothetical protein